MSLHAPQMVVCDECGEEKDRWSNCKVCSKRRSEKWSADHDALVAALDAINLDGPKLLSGPFSSPSAAVCTLCGAMVLLGDYFEKDGKQIERGVWLHTTWHNDAALAAQIGSES